MKILQLSYSLSSGGAERFVVDLCNRLAIYSQHEVILLTTDDDSIPRNIHYLKDLYTNVRFINLHCRSGLSIKAFRSVYKTIKREHPDIVHAHCDLLLLLFPCLFLKHVNYIHTLHNLAGACLRFKCLKLLYGWLYRKCVSPITISKTCRQSFIELYGQEPLCITNGREPLKPSGTIPREMSFTMNDEPVFIHVARCSEQKQQRRLFYAFDKLQSEGVKFQLVVLGAGYEKEWMPKYEGNSQIHIIGIRNNIADYMAQADYFVLSSDYEGLPLSLLEAMSLGVIPICTPAGGVIDVIEDGRNGYMTDTFDDDEFYLKIKQIIDSKSPVVNKEYVISNYYEHFSMERCAKEYNRVYEMYAKK